MSEHSALQKINAKHTIPVFCQKWWLDIIAPNYDFVFAEKGDEITGLWAYQTETKMGVKLMRTPLLTPYLGPVVFYPGDLKPAAADNFQHEVVGALYKKLPPVEVMNLNIAPEIVQVGLFKNNGLNCTARQTFYIDLNQGEETIFADFKESTRRNIKQGEKSISVLRDDSLLPLLFNFYEHTLTGKKGKSVHFDYNLMQRLYSACTENNAGCVWVAKSGDDVLAMIWQVWDKEKSYYLMGAKNNLQNENNAMPCLLWHAIKHAKTLGCTTFDFEGSMDPGVERFFRTFGATRKMYLQLTKNTSKVWKLKELLRG